MKQFEHIELREKVLKRIRNALINKTDVNAELLNSELKAFKEFEHSIPFEFAKNFIENNGFFFYAENEDELKNTLNSLLQNKNISSVYCGNEDIANLINTGITAVLTEIEDIDTTYTVITECDFLCARTGSVLLSSFLSCGRNGFANNEILIIVATIEQILPDIQDAIIAISQKYADEFPSLISFISGTSKSTSFQNEIISGAQGSKEIYVFIH